MWMLPLSLHVNQKSNCDVIMMEIGGDQVGDLSSVESGNILSWRLIMKYFLPSVLALLLIQKGHLSVSCERMCTSTG